MRILCVALSFVLLIMCAVTSVSAGAQCSVCRACAQYKGPVINNSPSQEPSGNGMVRKLGRGAANVLGGFTEIFNQMCKSYATGGPLAAFTWGIANGIGMSGLRFAVGAYEIITFPIPVPPGYKPILDEPDFFLKDEAF